MRHGPFPLPRGLLALAILGWGGAAAAALPSPSSPGVIPIPAVETPRPGVLHLPQGAPIVTAPGDGAALSDARWLADELARDRGLVLRPGAAGDGPGVWIERVSEPALGPEGYRLDVSATGVRLEASTDAGLFDATATLLQLLTPEDGRRGAIDLGALHIEDAPRFAWRGLMLDSVRHMQSIGFIEALIDQMARYKLDVLHWHLSDDQGWRLEIKGYPRLAAVGGWRADPQAPGGRYGGVYSQDEVRALVAYAGARHVAIVPEIEMPGHASAALLAYPSFGLRPVDPSTLGDWGVFPNLYAPSEAAIAFQERVLDEVMALFPSHDIHVGGDEAIKDYWRASPSVQQRMKALGLKDEDALQAWFMGRIGAYLAAHGRRMVGWEDMLQGAGTAGLPKDAAVMSWRGLEGAGLAAAAGHDVVLTPGRPFYFDNRQSDSADEPPGRGLVIPLEEVYRFEPALPGGGGGRLLGVQGSLWTEYVRNEAEVEYMAFPREIAVAEMAWSEPGRRNWPDFLQRLPQALRRDEAAGLAPATSAFAVRAAVKGEGAEGLVALSLSTQAGLGDIRFTLDGVEPTPASPRWERPVEVAARGRLHARAFLNGRPLAPELSRPLDRTSLLTRDSHEMTLCSDRLTLNLPGEAAPGLAHAPFLLDVSDPCWIWKGADLGRVAGLSAGVGRAPFNLQFGDDALPVAVRPAGEGTGALQVRLDGCAGELVATLPLDPTTGGQGVDRLQAPLRARPGRHDLCFVFTRRGVDPIYALAWVQLQPAPMSASAPTSTP